ncbi:hypothetical protein [Parapedobacter sp. 10938]|uniref:hypothetical protein n=1 Tax=Parapedobacter flavus TaxID=3110225 RepID=UPI002DB76120|nr:hypothetical protein [Parapedobacter sp. 10938]MEC3880891.1 hypothetical protein [Parapedobacter sp. 10938]
MKKILFWLVPIALFSCEKTVYSPDPVDDNYSLQAITYEVGDKGKMETFVRPLHSFTYFNNTSVVQQVSVDPLADVKESSLFMSDDERAFTQLDGPVPNVAVPLTLDDGVVTLGETKWPYRSEVVEIAPSLNFRDTIEVPPETRLTLTMNVYFNKLDLAYTATFKGEPTGTVIDVKGQWKGVTVAKVEKQIEFH